MVKPKKVKVKEVVEEVVPTAPEVVEVQPHVVSKPTDGTVNDRVAPVLPSLNDPGQS